MIVTTIFSLLLLRFTITKAISIEVINIFEGKVDKNNIPKLATHIRINGEMYSIITPNFEQTEGNVKLKTLFDANIYEDQKIVYTVNSQSEIKGSGNVGLHMQRFDSINYQQNLKQYEEFSDFTYKYLNELLKEKKSVDINVIKNLDNNYVYFGSLTKGKDPQNELIYHEESSLEQKQSSIKAISSAKSQGQNDDSFNYAVTNLNRQSTGNNFQHHFSIIKGEIPDSLIQIETFNQQNYLLSDIDSHTRGQRGEDITFAQTDGSAFVEKYGYSEQLTQSYRDTQKLETRGKTTSVSIKKEYYLDKINEIKCELDQQNPDSRILQIPGTFLESSKVDKSKIFQCLYLVKIYNSLTKHYKKVKYTFNDMSSKLEKMSPKKAINFIRNYKKLSGKPVKIQFSTVTSLAEKGYKKDLKKLFERKAFLLKVPYTSEQPSMLKFFLKSVVGFLGLRYGAKKYKDTHLEEKINELKVENGEVIQHNMMLKLSRQNEIQTIDDLIESLDQNFQSLSQRLMKQAYDLKSTIDFSLNHVQRNLHQEVEPEQADEQTEKNKEQPIDRIQLNLSEINLQTRQNR